MCGGGPASRNTCSTVDHPGHRYQQPIRQLHDPPGPALRPGVLEAGTNPPVPMRISPTTRRRHHGQVKGNIAPIETPPTTARAWPAPSIDECGTGRFHSSGRHSKGEPQKATPVHRPTGPSLQHQHRPDGKFKQITGTTSWTMDLTSKRVLAGGAPVSIVGV